MQTSAVLPAHGLEVLVPNLKNISILTSSSDLTNRGCDDGSVVAKGVGGLPELFTQN